MLLYSLVSIMAAAQLTSAKYVIYLTGQHSVVPAPKLVSQITHVALAFMRPLVFSQPSPTEWPMFTTVKTARSKFANGTAIMVAIGGWGETWTDMDSDQGRKLFAKNVKRMVDETGADGNGEDYKQVPNSEKAWEIEAYPRLLSEIRKALGPNKLISAAVPGLRRDMLAFTNVTIPLIESSLDFFNIMTYDLMNRRDSITKHHTGVKLSLNAVNAYLKNGVPPEKANLGFAFYVKWFKTDPHGGCDVNPIGCKTALLEDSATGGDLGQAGGFSWHDEVPSEFKKSFGKALAGVKYDKVHGGSYYWDADENMWWTWDTPEAMLKKFALIVENKSLGGVFAWGLGEDAPKFDHLKALTAGLEREQAASSFRVQREL